MEQRFTPDVLGESECWDLLSRTVVGRLAVCLDGRAHIFPVNYVTNGASIVFRTAEGTKLSAARHHHVSFEIDGYEPDRGLAWSVIAAGAATEILDPDEWDDARSLPLFPWHVAPKGHFIRIAADEISGRRFYAPYAGPTGFHRGGAD